LTASRSLVLVDGDIGKQETATKTVEAAIKHFGTIGVLVNNAGISTPSASQTLLPTTSTLGLGQSARIPLHHPARCETDAEAEVGNVVTITAALADHPMAGVNASVPMITKGGLNA